MKKPIRNYIILITIVGLFFCVWLIVTLLQGHNMISSQKAYASIPMEKRFDIYAKTLSDTFEEADVTMKYDKNAAFPKNIGSVEIKEKYDIISSSDNKGTIMGHWHGDFCIEKCKDQFVENL